MSVPTTSWSETTPAGTDLINLGDNRIREMKTQIREVVDVDHKFDSSGQDADMGKHNQCSFLEQADIGTGAEGKPILGAQTIGGKAELVFTDEDDNDIQLTSGGVIGGADISTTDIKGDTLGIDTNNTYITSKDAAGTGTVDLIKADGSDVVVVPDGVQTATNAAPTDDKGVANKKYVDDNKSSLGTWGSQSTSTAATQAATDGFLVGYADATLNDTDYYLTIYSDSNSNPTTIIQKYKPDSGISVDTDSTVGFTVPIRKNDYYKFATTNCTVYHRFIPLS